MSVPETPISPPLSDDAPLAAQAREPLFNLPPLTLYLLILFTVIHLARAVSLSFNQQSVDWFAFIPAAFTAHPEKQFYTLLTYGLLHFGWLHYFMNMTGFMAFGSGVERWFGKKWLMIILCGGAVVGALGHWALDPQSVILLGGASAGISALFGAILPAISQGRGYWSAVIAFVLTNAAIGIVGMPTQPGLAIAWQAHIFGFAFGLAITQARLYRNVSKSKKTS